MADYDEPEPPARQPFLKPFDRRQIQMVGRLVQQQHIRIAGKCVGQGRAARLAARQAHRAPCAVHRQAMQQGVRHMDRVLLVFGQAGGSVIQYSVKSGKVWFLWQIGDPDPLLSQPLARIRFDLVGQQL